MLLLFLYSFQSIASAEEPADMLPKPRAKACKEFQGDVQNSEEAAYAMAEGLSFNEIFSVLNETVQYALYCEQPAGYSSLNMTFDLVIGCNGIVILIDIVDHGGAPEAYTNCVTSVLYKADFPGHDLPDGQTVTYPVNVAW